MKKIILAVLLSIAILFSFTILAKKTPVASSDYSKPILVNSSRPEVVISLASNKATGYSWFLESYDHHFIKPISQNYKAPNKKSVGGSGVSRWMFKVDEGAFNVPQILHITLIYGRSWNMNNAKKKIITVVTQPD